MKPKELSEISNIDIENIICSKDAIWVLGRWKQLILHDHEWCMILGKCVVYCLLTWICLSNISQHGASKLEYTVLKTLNTNTHKVLLTTYWANRVGNCVQVETLSFPETYSGQLIEHKKVLLREEGVRGSYLFSANCLHPWGLIGERKIKSKYHDYLLGKQGWELSPN